MKVQSLIEKLWLQNTELKEAVKVYLNRKHRKTHPSGEFDSAGRWYPDASENLNTDAYRTPSRSYPYSYMLACRTLNHVVEDVFGITAPSALAAAKKLARITENDLTVEYAKKVIDLENIINTTDIDMTEIDDVERLRETLNDAFEVAKTTTQRNFIEKELEKLNKDIEIMIQDAAA